MNKSYSELCKINTFEERFNYLKTTSKVGEVIFGSKRYLNQTFYKSKEWKSIRNYIITRDSGNDLGVEGRPISGSIYIHHINPINEQDIINRNLEKLLDPENLICVSDNTHKAIHYGSKDLLYLDPIVRHMNDTCPWKN